MKARPTLTEDLQANTIKVTSVKKKKKEKAFCLLCIAEQTLNGFIFPL